MSIALWMMLINLAWKWNCMHYMILYALAGAYPGQVTFFPLTGDMEVEYDPVKAQSVVCCSRNLVDANFTVDMLDPVVDGAYIHIRYSGSITKVHCYTCHGAKTLAKEKKILSLTL